MEIREDLQKFKLFTIDDIAPVIGKSHLTIKRYLLDGKLKGTKVGGTWRISEEDLNEFLGRTPVKEKAEEDLELSTCIKDMPEKDYKEVKKWLIGLNDSADGLLAIMERIRG